MLDRQQIQRAFNRAAGSYASAAVLQREVEGRLHERLDYMTIEPSVVLDAGAGLCDGSRRLASRYPEALVIALDQADAMLNQASALPIQRVCARMEALPLADHSVDLIISSLALQWCTEPARVFDECRRVLKPGGILLFSTFGPDTLYELRRSWAKVDKKPHVNQFADMHEVGDLLLSAGFRDPVMDMEHLTVTYDQALSLMRDLKAIGAHNVHQKRQRGLTGKASLKRVIDAYEAYRSDGLLPATYELVYGHAVGPDPGQPMRRGDMHVTAVPVDKIRRR